MKLLLILCASLAWGQTVYEHMDGRDKRAWSTVPVVQADTQPVYIKFRELEHSAQELGLRTRGLAWSTIHMNITGVKSLGSGVMFTVDLPENYADMWAERFVLHMPAHVFARLENLARRSWSQPQVAARPRPWPQYVVAWNPRVGRATYLHARDHFELKIGKHTVNLEAIK